LALADTSNVCKKAWRATATNIVLYGLVIQLLAQCVEDTITSKVKDKRYLSNALAISSDKAKTEDTTTSEVKD
jgi:hypothetical protein